VQHRGKGGSQYRAPSKGKIAPSRYPFVLPNKTYSGMVMNILHERGRSTPLAQVRFEGNSYAYLPAVTGLTVGSKIEIGSDAKPTSGNILPLNKIPEGTVISNIEKNVGDGGKLVKASGVSAVLFSQTPEGAIIRMPSGRTITLDSRCRATLGVMAGGGRLEKPFLRAGDRWHLMKAKGHMYPRMRGIAMAVVHHPFGGGRHQHPGKSTSTSRNAPPGRKVGHIAPRKTGRKRIPRIDRGVKR
jgi:large subunit ribosomal protein L2